jgi:hypothetical protein
VVGGLLRILLGKLVFNKLFLRMVLFVCLWSFTPLSTIFQSVLWVEETGVSGVNHRIQYCYSLICVIVVSMLPLSFYDFSIGIWNYSDIMLFLFSILLNLELFRQQIFATVKSTIYTDNSSNTVLLFLFLWNSPNMYTLVWKHTNKWRNICTFHIPSDKKIFRQIHNWHRHFSKKMFLSTTIVEFLCLYAPRSYWIRWYIESIQIKVITKLPNSEQFYKDNCCWH